MNCEWCSSKLEKKHKDHAFSRLLGGQLAGGLWVYDCEECRKIISKAEEEVAHRSYFSLFRIAAGLKPRHPKRTSSGRIEPKIRLAKNPTSKRYSVFSLRVGDSIPEVLPALEVDFNKDMLFFHGTDSGSPQLLIKEVCSFFDSIDNNPGVHRELPAPLIEEFNTSILNDPDFNPRMFLSHRGKLEICARNVNECIKLMKFIGELSKKNEFRNYKSKSWASWNMPSGTPHHFAFVYDRLKFDRVILKIALGVLGAYLRLSDAQPWHCVLHDMVRGTTVLPEGLIKYFQIEDFEHKNKKDYLIALLIPEKKNIKAIISIYGEFYSIEIEDKLCPPELSQPVGAFCHPSEPRVQRWYNKTEANNYANTLTNMQFNT
jgi:hypothetical protein